jgi:hypothetical protein
MKKGGEEKGRRTRREIGDQGKKEGTEKSEKK